MAARLGRHSMRALWLCVLITTWAVAKPLLAQAPLPLSVSRGPGADDCPDAPGLLARIEEVRNNPPRADQPPYEVTFGRDANGVYSQIMSAQTGAERILTDAAPDCVALAQATAVTLALLFDADAHALEQPAPQPPPARAPAPPATPVAPTYDPASEHRLTIHYGPGGLVGVIAPIAFAIPLELGYAHRAWRAAIGGLYTFARPHELGSGRVSQSLAVGHAVGCFAPWQQDLWRLDVCAGVMAGAVHGAARGFGDNRRTSRGWFAAALEARFGRLPDWLGSELSVALLVPATRRDFAVEGAGVAYRSSPVGLLFSLRAGFSIFSSGP